MEIFIGSNTSKPGCEQVASQMKAPVMSGALMTGGPIPFMRSHAKSIHVSAIMVQKACEDLQRDGLLETTVGRGSYVSARNKKFCRQQRQIEARLQEAADIGRRSGIPANQLVELLTLFDREDS